MSRIAYSISLLSAVSLLMLFFGCGGVATLSEAQAACEALKRFPAVNASIDGDDVVYHGYQDIGVAVSTPGGLVVPVQRDADFTIS